MFERFTRAARQTVLDAVRAAQDARVPEVTDEHLLLGLLRQQGTTTSTLLADAGVTAEVVSGAYRAAERKGGLSDAEAASLLSEFGIDVDQVVAQVEGTLGQNALAGGRRMRRRHIPFTDTAKSLLAGALREGKAMRDRQLGDVQILLAISAHGGVAAQLLDEHGLSYVDLRRKLSRAS